MEATKTKADVADLVGATKRGVESRVRDGKPSRVVVASRTYPTTIDDAWDALTNAERIPRWFLPVHGDLRVGGRYQLEGNAGGTITQCEPPRRLAVTWELGEAVSWVEVLLVAEKGGTRLELRHEAHVDDHWKQFGPGATGVGWDMALWGLELHFASGGATVDRDEAMSWLMSADGKGFVRGSSESWCEAAIESGTDEEAAHAAAARTTAFYTGEGGEPARS